MARKYTLGERAIIYSAVAGGVSLKDINETLIGEQQKQGLTLRTMPESSYKMVKNKYIPKLGLDGLWKQIHKPQSLGDLTKK